MADNTRKIKKPIWIPLGPSRNVKVGGLADEDPPRRLVNILHTLKNGR